MLLIQMFLPLYDKDGRRLDRALFDTVRAELTARFGGATAFARAPALGAWADDRGEVQHDDVVLVEVMTDTLDRAWWSAYRTRLEHRFRQDTVLMRALQAELL